MANPWDNDPVAQPAQATNPWDNDPVVSPPKLPDVKPVQQKVQDNLNSQNSSNDNGEVKEQAPQTPEQRLDTGLGFSVSSVLKGGKQDTPLPAYLRANLVDSYKDGSAVNAGDYMQSTLPAAAHSSTLGAFARGAEQSALPSAAGFAAFAPGAALGAELGAPVAAATGPFAPITEGAAALIGGLLTSFGGSYATSLGQKKFLDANPEIASRVGLSNEQLLVDMKEQPAASFAGGLTPNLLFMRPGFSSVGQVALGGALGAGQEAGREYASGENLDPNKIALSTIMTAITNKETALGKGISSKVMAGYEALKPTVAAATGKPVDAVTPDDIDQTIAKGFQKTAPTAQDFHDTATVMNLPVGTLHQIYKETGVNPDQVYSDVQNNPKMVDELIAGKTPDQYESLKEPPVTLASQDTDYAAAQKKILDTISIGEKDPNKPGLTGQQMYTAMVDRFDPIHDVMQHAENTNLPAADKDAYKIMRLAGSIGDKGRHFLHEGTFDFNTSEVNGKSLDQVLAPVKDDLDGFRAYITAKRAAGLEGRGIQSGKDLDAAQTVLEGGKGKFEQASKDLSEYQGKLLTYLKDSGVVSQELYDKLQPFKDEFIPYYRLMEPDETSGGGKVGSGNPIKRIKGSERDTIDPIESIVRNTFAFTKVAEMNAAKKSMYDFFNEQPDPSQYYENSKTPIRPVKVSDKEMQNFLKENNISDVPEDALTVFRATRQPLAKDEIGFFNEGKYKTIKVDPDLAEAFNSTPRQQHGLLMSLLKFPASLLRTGLTTPEFIIRHLVRNQISASTLAEKGNVPFYDTFKGLMSYINKDESYQQALRSGALPNIEPFMNRETIQDEMSRITGEKPDQNIPQKLLNIVKSPIDLLHWAQQSLETSTRLGAFKRALGDQDLTKANLSQAAFHARNIAPDPARIGSQTGLWNSITALFNTEIQHTDQLTNALKTNTIPTLAKLMAGVTIPSLALWAYNHNDERVKQAPQWEKDFFWLIPIGDPKTHPEPLRIPKPFLMGELFGSVPERLMDWAVGNDPDNKHLEAMVNDLLEWGTPNTIPTAIEPYLEQVTNHSFFKGTSLVSDHLNRMLPQDRFTPYTSELTKLMGATISHVPYVGETSTAAPIVLDNYIYKWSGGIGTYALQIADASLRKAGVLPDPVKPLSTLADEPIIKAFFGRYPSSNAQSIDEFQENFKAQQQVFNSIQEAKKEGDTEKANAIQNRYSFSNSYYNKLDAVNLGLSHEFQLIQKIQQNPDIKPLEKRNLIDNAYFEMIRMSKTANDYANKKAKSKDDEDEQQ